MVSIIESSRDTRGTMLYNELKVTEEKALFLGAFNYWQETETLTFDDKLQRFRDLTVLNERTQAHTLHISLNFHPDDDLTDKKMKQIATEYMKRIEFADQPWLLYRHIDAGHPHMHIVTTNIRPDGSRIKNDERSPRKLMIICKELERIHQLTPAGDWKLSRMQTLREKQSSARRLKYGESATKSGITNVLDHVLENYNYTSLEQLNAVLSLYHVRADRGSEHGIMYRNRGLYYRMIDEKGRKIGAPIKASSFPQRPILNYLEQKFADNKLKLQQRQSLHVTVAIDWTLAGRLPDSLRAFRESLQKENIQVVIDPLIRSSPSDQPLQPYTGHGFFYVDFGNKAIYRDTDLGDRYTAAAILERSGLKQTLQTLVEQQHLELKPKDRSGWQQPASDPTEKLRICLGLARQHDQWQLDREKEKEALRQQQDEHRHRLSHRL